MANTHRAYANVPGHDKPRLVAGGTEEYCKDALSHYTSKTGIKGFVKPITAEDHK
jgi:hypothetical protein